MATQNASKWGYVRVLNQSSHTAARGASTGQASSNPSSVEGNAFSYEVSNSGRGNAYSIYRTFIYIDTSGITNTVTAASINIKGYLNGGSRGILVPSTAFSGDGSTNLTGGDFGNLSFNTNYNGAFTTWSTTGNNSIPLESTARSDIQNNNYFICAIIEYDYDYSNTDPGAVISRVWGVDFSTTPYLDYTESGGGGGSNFSTWNNKNQNEILNLNNISFPTGVTAIDDVPVVQT